MKTIFKMIGIIILFFLILSAPSIANAQKVALNGEDTVIMITPKNLRTINSIIVDYEATKEELSITQQINLETQEVVIAKDSIIVNQSVVIKKQSDQYEQAVINLNAQIKIEQQKRTWTTVGVAGAAVGAVVLILLVK